MKFSAATMISLLASIFQITPSIASPLIVRSPNKQAGGFEAQITFISAAGAQFRLSVPTDNTLFTIYNPLSVSKISSSGGATCEFDGIDGSKTVVVGAQTVDVGPPQTQVSGSCLAF